MAWKRYRFKENKVYAEVDEAGNLRVDRDRVQICYQPGAERTYKAAASNLEPLDEDEDGLGEDEGRGEDGVGGESGGRGEAAAASASDTPATPRTDGAGPRVRELAAPTSPATLQREGTRARPRVALHEDEELALLADLPEGVEPIIVYTDGACRGNPGPAGLGVVLISGRHRKELSEYLGPRGTNNIAELTAVLRALETIHKRELPVLLHTDSEYVIGVLTRGWKAKANRELILEIRELIRDFDDLRFIKVPAHSGVPENERADELGNLAIAEHHGERGSGRG